MWPILDFKSKKNAKIENICEKFRNLNLKIHHENGHKFDDHNISKRILNYLIYQFKILKHVLVPV